MKLLHGLDDPAACRGGFVSIGNFDGVHRGHQAMIAALVRHAQAEGVPATVFTFDPPPVAVLRPGQVPPRLSTLERKAELLAECGVDCVLAWPTDRELLSLTPEEFFEEIVRGRLDACGLVEGPNFFFGHDRAGDVHTLKRLCDDASLVLEIVPPVEVGGRMVSSSAIRSLISAGRIAEAVPMLGRPYRLRGRVVRGAVRGRDLGFPTANLEGIETLLPPDGVYAALAWHQGRAWPAAVHLGPNLTFGEQRPKLEAHLLDFSGDLYNQPLDLDLIDRLRDTTTFAGPEDLKNQLARDVAQVRALLERYEEALPRP